jgi:hypothetical protein
MSCMLGMFASGRREDRYGRTIPSDELAGPGCMEQCWLWWSLSRKKSWAAFVTPIKRQCTCQFVSPGLWHLSKQVAQRGGNLQWNFIFPGLPLFLFLLPHLRIPYPYFSSASLCRLQVLAISQNPPFPRDRRKGFLGLSCAPCLPACPPPMFLFLQLKAPCSAWIFQIEICLRVTLFL